MTTMHSTLLTVVGIMAGVSMAIRYSYRVAVANPYLNHLLTEGKKAMQTQIEHALQNCVRWNMRQRDDYRRLHNSQCATPMQKAEAARNLRRHQNNIDRLNEQLRRIDRIH